MKAFWIFLVLVRQQFEGAIYIYIGVVTRGVPLVVDMGMDGPSRGEVEDLGW